MKRNPGFRRAAEPSVRLAGVGEYLLGRGPAPHARAGTGVRRLPFLVALDPAQPPRGLEPREVMLDLTRKLYERADAGEAPLRWQLYSPAQPEHLAPEEAGLVLVLATASLPGIRLAYGQIKRIPRHPHALVSTLLAGTEDRSTARRCQERLALGAARFLELRVEALGYLSGSAPRRDAELGRAAERVLDLLATRPTPERAREEDLP